VHLFVSKIWNETSRLFAGKETAGKTPPNMQINQSFKIGLIWMKIGEIRERDDTSSRLVSLSSRHPKGQKIIKKGGKMGLATP